MAGHSLIPASRVRRIVVVLFFASFVGVGGCHDPRFLEKREIRRKRIDHHLTQYREHDAAGPQRIRQTVDIHKKLQQHHKESLRQTCALCKKMHDRDVERWQSERDLRRERARTHLRGKPDQIDDTWAKMVY